jgi:hypothetical protein
VKTANDSNNVLLGCSELAPNVASHAVFRYLQIVFA